jgi:hypothetical protein
VRFIEVPTPEFLLIEDLNQSYDVAKRFVKVSPRLAASERDTFDANAIKTELLERGALSVVIAPIIIPEARAVETERLAAKTPREAVKAWFEDQRLTDDERAAAVELVFGFMDLGSL